ncbi:MAG: ABC transporter permease [Armatimonadetes bacterium]|nr:ABC transporter permease [Armatimonadota bacterium]
MKLLRPILLRLVYALVSLLFISAITFVAADLAPGDAARIVAGEKASPEAYQMIRKQMKLDRPMWERYGSFIAGAVKGDFGNSYHGIKEPVAVQLKANLPMTLRISLWAILLAAFVGISLGLLAGLKENKPLDRLILGFSTFGVTVPNFVLGPLLVLIFATKLDKLPTSWAVERVAPDYYYLILPVIILSLRPMATLTRLMRATTIDTLQQEFVKLATAKGVPRPRLILRHVMPNAILPVVTAIGTSFGFLLTGSFVVETFFLLPGIGHEAIEAIQKRDTPVILATTLVAGAMFVIVNLIVDILQPILDPRIREAQI